MEDIFNKYQAGNMFEFARWQESCHLRPVPTIEQAFYYDKGHTLLLLDSYTTYALRFCNAFRKPDPDQIRMMSCVMISSYPRMKLTQLMLFWVRLLSGQLGKLYNIVDPLDITTRLNKFYRGECKDMYTYGHDSEKWQDWEPPKDEEQCQTINIQNYGT